MKVYAKVLAVACVILMIGAASVYWFDPGQSYSASADPDGIDVTVDGMFPSEVTCRIFSGTSVPEKICLYLDPKYSGDLVPYRDQERYVKSTMEMLSDRGYRNTEKIDAEGLAALLSDPSSANKTGILFTSGAIPDTIYPDDAHNGLTVWFANGGTVYWSGPDMGVYRAHSDGTCTKTSGGMFGEYANSYDDGDYLVRKASEYASVTGFTNYHGEYGLSASYTATASKILGIFDDYSSFSVVSVGTGRAYVLGTYISNLEVESLSVFLDTIVAGITENSVTEYSGTFHKGYGSGTFRLDFAVSAGDVLYVFSGKPISENGAAFRF